MNEPREIRFGNAQLRPQQRQLLVDGKQRQVGARAFDLLLALVERHDRVVRKDELLECVWPGMVVEENNLQVHISSLRKVLGPDAITTVPGRGYRFTAPLDDAALRLPGPSVAPGGAQGNLPAAIPVLYGRERDLAQLRAIAVTHRVLTIVGPGGIGKTVLAHALAHELPDGYPDGVWWAELATITEPSLVPAAVAGVLHANFREGGVPELVRSIAHRHLLLVLDNCEHLPQAASELAWALYRDAPRVHVLATSREPLKLADEHVYRLNGLEVPARGEAAARNRGAVAMFEARVQAADASFELGPDDIDEASEICRHLDGIPLAIEFAAARVPLFGVRGLREQLDERFRVLTRGARLAQPRHQTLHSALEWSFALLTPEQQAAFRRLGVFAGSFSLASAQSVAGAGAIDPWRVLDHLGDLVDKSLVAVEPSDVPRYRLLETTRAFAWGKLADAGEVEAARRAHARAMLELFDASCRDELSVPLSRRMARHSADIDNLRAALDWCFGPAGDGALGAALAGASAWVWREGPGRVEGVRRLALALDTVDAQTPPLVEVRLCLEWTMLAIPQAGERELALAQRCTDLCRAIGDRARLALALGQLARIRSMRDEMDAALQAIDEQQSLVRTNWPAVLRARVLLSQGCVLFQARAFEACLAANEEVYRLAAELDDPLAIASALVNQEQCAAALGRWQECVERGRDLMALVERQRGLYTCLESTVAANFCLALVNAGAFDEALEHVRRTRPLFARTGGLLCVIDALGIIALEQGGRADAARIMGCADAHYAQGGAREPVEESMHVALSQRLAAAFAPAQLRQLLDEGAALDAEAAAALVLRDAGPLSPGASRGSAVRAALPDAPGKHRAHA